jgi:hypothetical protein
MTKEHYIKNQIPVSLHNRDRSGDANKKKLEWSAKEYQKMQEFFTRLWTARGIKWKD